jgi:hypothetical protein
MDIVTATMAGRLRAGGLLLCEGGRSAPRACPV